ncbi:hypothetical protein [Methylomonas sp. AM2-LC]|uniref:hypothetical protein n=1 Tax=Methylomonas sp. AM2-LC TaxID=3153301 RepID=UPI003266C5A2
MTIESIYYNSFRQGKQPKIQKLSIEDHSDITIPLRLYIGQMMGCAGYRQTNQINKSAQWYWPRRNGNWWLIPEAINRSINRYIYTEGKSNFLLRSAIGRDNMELWKAAKEELRHIGGIVSIDDDRIAHLINYDKVTETPIPKKLGDRIEFLYARRNVSDCEIEKEILDWMLIEICQPIEQPFIVLDNTNFIE